MAKKGQNLVNGIDGVNGLPAIDFNSATREVQDALIECQPSIPDPSGTAQYGANNEIKQYLDLQTISRASAFICSGSGNAYVLTTDTAVHLRQFTFIQKYSKIHFIASFTNTGSCTVNVDFFGIKSIKLANGSDPLAGYITANNRYTMYYNGTNWVLTNPTISSTYIKQPIILSNNTTNPNTHIDFAAGNFAFSDGSSFANLSAITKRLDANWVVGTNQGGLDVGVKANSTRYYCYAIYNPTTLISDVIFSISAPNNNGGYTGSNMPSGFTKNRYIGTLATNVSGNVMQGTWNKDGYFEHNTPVIDFTGSITTSRVARTLTVKPNSRAVINVVYSSALPAGSISKLFLSDLNKADNSIERLSGNIGYKISGEFQIQTNSSSQIGTRTDNANNSIEISTIGFYDLDL